jgi:hypothetical protein
MAPPLLMVAVFVLELDCACVTEKATVPITNNTVNVVALAFMDTPC